jgi:hypothetical protein
MNSIRRMAGLLVMLVLLLSNLSQVVYVSEAQTTTVTTTSTITSTVTSYTTVTSSTVTRTVTGTRTTYTTSTTTADVTSTHTSTQTVATTVTRTTTTTITEQQTQDTIRPTVRVIAPNGGERLSPGSVFRIRWEASDNVGVTSVYIRLYQEGVMRVIIADNLPNTGYYDWTVPNRPGSNYKIVVIARDAAGNFGEDESDGTFEIVGAAVTAILQIGIRHTYIGDLRIWVGVEGGREVLIWNREGGSAQNLFREWDLLQLGFTTNDLPPSESRRWYLRIRDEANRDEGRLEYFRIIYQGQTYESQEHPEIRDYQEVRAWISPTTPQPFDFRISVLPSSRMVIVGEIATFTVRVDLVSGSPEQVHLSVSGLPSGTTGSFNPASGTPTFTSTLSIRTSSITPPGQYSITIRASGGGQTREDVVTLLVLQIPTLNVNVRDVATSSRNAYFRLETPSYGDVLSQMREELSRIIGPGLRAIYVHEIKVRIEASSGTQMIILPLQKELNIGPQAALFIAGQIIGRIQYIGLLWDFFMLIFDIFGELDEFKPVNVYEFSKSYPANSINDVVNSLLNKKDKYIVHLESVDRRDNWQVTFGIIVTYSLDYTGTVVPGYPPTTQLTWTRFVTISVVEE